MYTDGHWLPRQLVRLLALALLVSMFHFGQLPSVADDEAGRLAQEYGFTPLAIAMPAGLDTQTIRRVNKSYHRVPAWVSSVGAGIAVADLTGNGRADDLCLTDPRIDEVVVTPAPVGPAERYRPFILDPGRLPLDGSMAPMGCVPGDFNADARTDLLVYYWGRTPIVYLARDGATELAANAFRPVEMVEGVSAEGRYEGPQWNTNAVAVSDFDGDGYPDVFVGNFWPHGPVLDDTVSGGVQMPASLSYALNGGENYVYRWTGGTSGSDPDVSYELAEGALPGESRFGWALAAAGTDFDGDLLPELYIAHDFGPDRLLHNRSVPGDIRFGEVRGAREPLVPRSKILGRSSFKGMGVDFGDLTGDGRYDIFVSNITTSYGIHESNFAFVDTAGSDSEAREQLQRGAAPYQDRSAPLGLAWSGWGWDVKLADLNNSGDLEVVQTTGFVKGRTNRWPQLQEMATTNDDLVSDPNWWPHVREGDDIAGDQTLAFFARSDSGRYVDLSHALGLAVPVPTRGVALGDATGDGRLDFAVARQWDEPIFYRNDSPDTGAFLGLHLLHEPGPHEQAPEPRAGVTPNQLSPSGSPVVDAQVRVTTSDGRTLLGRVDGGSGHAGKRSQEILIGLGEVSGPLSVRITWRDRSGQAREERMRLTPGWHSLQLGESVQEVTS